MTAILPNSHLPESAVEKARRMLIKMDEDIKKEKEKYKNLSSSEKEEWQKSALDLLQRMN